MKNLETYSCDCLIRNQGTTAVIRGGNVYSRKGNGILTWEKLLV